MSIFELIVIALSMAILAGIALRLTWLALRTGATNGEVSINRDGSFSATCLVCGVTAEISPQNLIPLSSAEKALVVRERPGVVKLKLVEFSCPSCDASHCYSTTRNSMKFVGVNLYQGQHFQANCKECQKAITVPPWRKGAFDRNVARAPGNLSELGLQCKLCGAICCVDCCSDATRKRTADGTLLCPRCYRGPNDQFFHGSPVHGAEPFGHPTY